MGLKLGVRGDAVGVSQLLAQFAHQFLELLGAADQDLHFELGPGHHGPLLDGGLVLLVDGVDLVEDLVVLLHLDELGELGDGQVEELLGEHVLLPLAVEAPVRVLAQLQQLDSLVEGHVVSPGAVAHVLLVLFLELVLEFEHFALGHLGEVLLEVVDFEVLAVGHFEQVGPVGAERVHFFDDLWGHFVLVHLEHSELFLDLIDPELHVHRLVLDLTYHIQQMLETVDAAHVSLQLLFIVLYVPDDKALLLAGDFK